MKHFVLILSVTLCLSFGTLSASSEGVGYSLPGFGKHNFYPSPNSQKGGFSLTADPIDPSNKSKVYKFTIKPGRCIGYDCDQQSVRSSLNQHPSAVQPAEAWYGWEMYFQKAFPVGIEQVKGFQQFNEFKDQLQCGLASLAIDLNAKDTFLSWIIQKPTGKKANQFGGDCVPYYKKEVIQLRQIAGSWHRFELFAKWSRNDDGRFMLYLDGTLTVDYSGPTCFADCRKMNYHLFGNYLCCTPNSKDVVEATVYYRFLSRSSSREKLVWK